VLWLGGALAAQPEAGHIGSRACSACHAEQARHWQASNHARSMQTATAQTVLGDFADARFEQDGQRSRFFRRNGKFWVNTEGPDGRLQDFEIRYTFGVEPLQQYLIALPGGRLQALGIAWDAQPRALGGQRWYALYPDSPPLPGEPAHWSGRDQNWNFMCASCHSTGLAKNFDLAKNSFATRWAEMNVACEACHGPGARHQAWARGSRQGDSGLAAPLDAMTKIAWRFDSPEQNIATPHGDVTAAQQAEEACYGCHSRRQELRRQAEPGGRFLDNYLPSLLEPTLYHADGQIDGEVFEYGSFIQSKMHRAGVTCSNCHQSHSLKLKAGGNALCAQCHRSEHYEQTSHHHHPVASPGAQCISCHMPQKTYMGVDVRHDHGFRIPRPDLAASGAPDTCSQCHGERNSQWAAEQIQQWTGHEPVAHFAPGLAAARHGQATLAGLATALDATQSGIVRASALALLPASRRSAAEIASAAADADALVRLGAARALAILPPNSAIAIGNKLLDDPRRAVRSEAARALAGFNNAPLAPETARRLHTALDELLSAELAAAERPESQVNLGLLHGRMGNPREAEQAFRTALRLAPNFPPALLGLAELYRGLGRDGEGESLLRRAISQAPANGEASHALGLLLIRQGRLPEAIPQLAQAVERDAGNARFALVHALALAENGMPEAARAAVEKARLRQPADRSLLETQISLEKRLDHNEAARQHEAEYRRLAE
jgi:tetratricopeptide (TPR) repeat protein